MALKRQQAAEDAIALHLASAESGTTYDYLPPGRIYGMQITSPETDSNDKQIDSQKNQEKDQQEQQQQQQQEIEDTLQVSQASIDMLCKLFPNKKRSVLELVLKRCNHDLLKAIEHFNLNAKHSDEKLIETSSSSAFKPVNSAKMKNLSVVTTTSNHTNAAIPLLTGNKVFMHGLYPFLPLFNPQPVMPSPVYVPSFCECEQCKHSIYSRLESRQQI